MRRSTAYLLLLASSPLCMAGILVGLAELLLGCDGRAAQWVAGPFLRSYEALRRIHNSRLGEISDAIRRSDEP
jgi:hypothetical protein